MRNKTRGCFALSIVLLAGLLSAGPGSAAPADVTKTRSVGDGVIASFKRTDGCVVTRATIFGQELVSKAPNEFDSLVTLTFSKLDTCKQEILTQGFGATFSTFNLVQAKSLSRATLTGSLSFNDFVGGQVHPVTFNIVFEAVAGRDQTVTLDRFKEAGSVFSSTDNTAVRSAVAQGTVTLDSESFFADTPSVSATMATGIARTTSVTTP